MARPIRVFVSYSHQDASYLERGSLLGFLRGLERDGVEFWADRRLVTGDDWDATIRAELERSDVVLAFVSQAFLDSAYCRLEMEISREQRKVILPIRLSACDWPEHPWLARTHFPPLDGKTVEEHFPDAASREGLFSRYRDDLREHVERIRSGDSEKSEDNPFTELNAIRDPARFVGRSKVMRILERTLEGGSVALVGDPKVGKSSLIWRLVERWTDASRSEVIGPIDLQAMEDRDDFYDHLASALQLDSGSWRSIRRTLRDRMLLLVLDEADSGPGRTLDGSDLGRLRAVSQDNQDFRVVTVSRGPLKATFPDPYHGSPAYNFLVPVSVGAFPKADALRLLEHPWAPDARPFASSTVEEILSDLAKERAAGHPFWLQRAAHHRFEALLDPERDWRAGWRLDREHLS